MMKAKVYNWKYLHIFLVVSLHFVLLLALVPSTALAKSSCSSTSDLDVAIDCLKSRHDAIADELEYTSDKAFGPNSKLGKHANPERLQHFENSMSNGRRAKVKNTKERFKKLAKDETRANGKNAGHLVPYDADADDVNEDGVCDYEQKGIGKYLNADCASIEQLNGEVQICNPEKKNKGKANSSRQELTGLECDRSFDSQEAVTDEEELDMIKTIGQMENTYNAVEDDLILMNWHLDNVNANLPDGNAALEVSAGGCVIPEPTEGLSEAASVLRGLTAAAQGASAIMDSASGQTVVVFGTGGNGRAAAVILNSAALAAELAYITVDEILSAETSALQTATMQCVVKLAGDIAAMQTLMIQQHTEIKNQLEAARVELVNILNTPHGQRDKFPSK
jgi:hypothetical protein